MTTQYFPDCNKINSPYPPQNISEEPGNGAPTIYPIRSEKFIQQSTIYYKKEEIQIILMDLARTFSPSPEDEDLDRYTQVMIGFLLHDICQRLCFNQAEITAILGTSYGDNSIMRKAEDHYE